MSTLLDTNILLRSFQRSHAMHAMAAQAVAALLAKDEVLCVAPQNLYEFWVVCTRPPRENGLGLTVAEAAKEVERIKAQFLILDETPAILPAWEKLVVENAVSGKDGHNARLVALMLIHGVEQLLTFNLADFQRFRQVSAKTPQEVLASESLA